MWENPGLLIKLFISEFIDNDFDDEFFKDEVVSAKVRFQTKSKSMLIVYADF